MGNKYFQLTRQRQEEISSLAEYIADEYCPDSFVDPEKIASKNEISFSFGDYGDSFDGLTEHEFGAFHIFINLHTQTRESERSRFTFAHELGHYFIDEHRIALKNGKTPAHKSINDFSFNNPVELEADFFASSLLMPSKRIIKECFRKKFSFRIIENLSTKYKVSTTATCLKFISVGNHPIMVIRTSKNKIDWFRCSVDFPFKWPKGINSHVPEFTLSGAYFKDNSRFEEELPISAIEWFENVGDIDADRQFYERCIYSEKYNFVLSIIWED